MKDPTEVLIRAFEREGFTVWRGDGVLGVKGDPERISWNYVSYAGELCEPEPLGEGTWSVPEPTDKAEFVFCPVCGEPMYFGPINHDDGDYICKQHGRTRTSQDLGGDAP
jgi:hypothetical protein